MAHDLSSPLRRPITCLRRAFGGRESQSKQVQVLLHTAILLYLQVCCAWCSHQSPPRHGLLPEHLPTEHLQTLAILLKRYLRSHPAGLGIAWTGLSLWSCKKCQRTTTKLPQAVCQEVAGPHKLPYSTQISVWGLPHALSKVDPQCIEPRMNQGHSSLIIYSTHQPNKHHQALKYNWLSHKKRPHGQDASSFVRGRPIWASWSKKLFCPPNPAQNPKHSTQEYHFWLLSDTEQILWQFWWHGSSLRINFQSICSHTCSFCNLVCEE